MVVTDVLTNVNTFIGDSSTDRVSNTDRYQALTEATAWLLEELGNEHMVDRAEVEFLPTVMWYKMDNLTPYLLTAGQLRFKEDSEHDDFTRVDSRDIVKMNQNRNAYAIERFDGDSYLGIVIPDSVNYKHRDIIQFNVNDGLTYTGINAENITGEKDAIRFDMENTGVTATGLSTTSESINLTEFENLGVLIFEFELTDVSDLTSISIKFGDNLTTDYWLGTVTQDINGNALVVGVNTLKVAWSDLTEVGTPDITAITAWSIFMNHDAGKAVATDFRISDLRIAEPIYLNFKYVFYRVGTNSSGTEIIEFTAGTDIPFFSERYPQYKFAVAHKAAGILYRSLQLFDNAREEDAQARQALQRYRKNFTGERDQGSTTFKVAGINLRGRRIRYTR